MDPSQTNMEQLTLLETMQQAPNQEAILPPVYTFIGGIVITAIICTMLAIFYTHFGKSLSNRGSFSRNFVVIGVTTMLVITIVKGSLALSLGLVGALSIVRFRTAVKEPEELGFLFLCIATGLGFGAGYSVWLHTFIAIVIILGILFIKHCFDTRDDSSNLYLMISSPGENRPTIDTLTAALKPVCAALAIKRFDDSSNGIEVAYQVAFNDIEQLEQARQALINLGENITVSFIDNESIV